MEQIQTFIQTLVKGVVQGFHQYVDNDLSSQLPLFVIAAVLIVFVLLKKVIKKFRNK